MRFAAAVTGGRRMCPACSAKKGTCIDSRPSSNGKSRRRRFVCSSCLSRWTTAEVVVKIDRRIP